MRFSIDDIESAPRNWVVVASADHVRRAIRDGITQACHGKAAPLKRIRGGDRVICYSPTESFGGGDRLQCFTAFGLARDGAPYEVEAENGRTPFRRDVDYLPAEEASILPLLDRLDFTRGRTNWGWPFRFGFFEVSGESAAIIAEAMAAELPEPKAGRGFPWVEFAEGPPGISIG
jgi:hypothetical protein